MMLLCADVPFISGPLRFVFPVKILPVCVIPQCVLLFLHILVFLA